MDLTVLGHVLSFSLLFSPLPLSLTGTQSKKKGKEEEEEAGEKNIWGLIKHGLSDWTFLSLGTYMPDSGAPEKAMKGRMLK